MVALIVPFMGCTDDGDGNGGNGPTVVINLSFPSVESGDPGTGLVYNATMEINKITPKDAVTKWTSLTVVIKDSMGSVLVQETPLSKDNGIYGSTVELWYVEEVGDETTADAGDKIMVTGMADTYEGAMLEILDRGERASSITFPTDFS
jgi:hypothetical protein